MIHACVLCNHIFETSHHFRAWQVVACRECATQFNREACLRAKIDGGRGLSDGELKEAARMGLVK